MKTPKSFIQNLKNNIITKQMLSDCLYSCNKRAKNCRDKERYYRKIYYDKYSNEEKYREKKEEYYRKKETLLSIIDPVCIHKEVYEEKIRIYDYEKPLYDEILASGNYSHSGCYFDRDLDEEVYFLDTTVPAERYYLFYKLGYEASFHTPIQHRELEKYDLPIINIGILNTFGHNIQDLLSNQFVDKVLELIKSGDYKLIDTASRDE